MSFQESTKDRRLASPPNESQSQLQSSSVDWWGCGQGGSYSDAQRGQLLLANLLRLPPDRFESEFWLRKPYRLQLSPSESAAIAADPRHPMHMLPLGDVKRLLFRRHPRPARWLHDVDATKWVHGKKRLALGAGSDGEVRDPAACWAAFERQGFSIRMVMPQQWHCAAFELCSFLQEYFGATVGCATYLTPPGTQGFAPHYDDVEVFVLQLEGTKRWRLYERPDVDTRPAGDTTQQFTEKELGPCIDDFILHPGEVLYLPRGTVHQAMAQAAGGTHSLHITFSTYQKHTWLHLLLDADVAQTPAAGGGGDDGADEQPMHTALADHAQTELRRLARDASAGVLDDLPANLLAKSFVVGNPNAAWDDWGRTVLAAHGGVGGAPLPAWLASELEQAHFLGLAMDRYAAKFLRNALPPPPPPLLPAMEEEEELPCLSQESWVRMCAPRCARLIDEAETCGEFDAWEKEESEGGGIGSGADVGVAPRPRLTLVSTVLNGRSLAEPSGPAFEVLPSLARSAQQLLRLSAGMEPVRVGSLSAFTDTTAGGEEDVREDCIDLLEQMMEYGVLVSAAAPLPSNARNAGKKDSSATVTILPNMQRKTEKKPRKKVRRMLGAVCKIKPFSSYYAVVAASVKLRNNHLSKPLSKSRIKIRQKKRTTM
ncbi:hypothetical protein CYMTET_39723 [Cymbomonas tetramitiformis]|uniref:Bifunctional lysine-specific demethylase and histidyl-hydroxylase n=1 Tax=Cymbomonas tetramitiformis TaxID=36881 RepID=A0AAE0CB90_9CHLO|nr:hypothetical protein CYMTET_39723 [Cymbomonas tetramitiformis]